jgi:hypothetical protein
LIANLFEENKVELPTIRVGDDECFLAELTRAFSLNDEIEMNYLKSTSFNSEIEGILFFRGFIRVFMKIPSSRGVIFPKFYFIFPRPLESYAIFCGKFLQHLFSHPFFSSTYRISKVALD